MLFRFRSKSSLWVLWIACIIWFHWNFHWGVFDIVDFEFFVKNETQKGAFRIAVYNFWQHTAKIVTTNCFQHRYHQNGELNMADVSCNIDSVQILCCRANNIEKCESFGKKSWSRHIFGEVLISIIVFTRRFSDRRLQTFG